MICRHLHMVSHSAVVIIRKISSCAQFIPMQIRKQQQFTVYLMDNTLLVSRQQFEPRHTFFDIHVSDAPVPTSTEIIYVLGKV